MRWRLRAAVATGVVVATALVVTLPLPAGWGAGPQPGPPAGAGRRPRAAEAPALPPPPAPPPPAATEAGGRPQTTAPRGDARPARDLAAGQRHLRRRLQRLVHRRSRDLDGVVAVAVLDERGRTVLTVRAGRPSLPASAQKLITAAATVGGFAPDFRYTTTVHSARPVRRDGAVRGDLVLVGGADPALASPRFVRVEPQRPRTALARLARRLQRRGVRRVTGRVVGDPGILAHEPVAAGWRASYLSSLYASRVSGLTVDAGQRLQRRDGVLRGRAARHPARQAAAALRRMLRRHGIRVDGGVAVRAGARGQDVQLARVRSPRIDILLRHAVQESDNPLADGLFRSLGAAGGDPTWRGAARTARTTLAPLQLDWSGVRLADGSGLSRRDRASAAFLARLQQRMWTSASAARWRRLLARAGHSGTLRARLTGTVAEGRFYGKTGTLRDVRSLVGTVVGPQGAAVHLAVVGNRLAPADTDRVRALADGVVTVAAEELHGCRRVPRRQPARSRAGPRWRLVCAAWPRR